MRVLLIGDSCNDIFRYGICERLCPEAPVPVFNPTKMTVNGGMALNVYENLKALNVDTDLITNDVRAVKTRYVDELSNQMFLRVDEHDKIKRIEESEINSIDWDKYEAVIISDYNKGFLLDQDVETILGAAKEHNVDSYMDTKKKIDSYASKLKFLKINHKEYLLNEFNVKKHLNKSNIIVTMGGDGAKYRMYYTKGDFSFHHVPTKNVSVRDLSGAGDTFLASLVYHMHKVENNLENSIIFANKCASYVVTKKGVVPVDLEKI